MYEIVLIIQSNSKCFLNFLDSEIPDVFSSKQTNKKWINLDVFPGKINPYVID